MGIRLNKYVSDSGYCSRREADRLIAMGRVLVNGQTAEVGMVITNEDSVEVDDTIIKEKSRRIYLALNKPVGVTCTTDTSDPDNIISFVNFPSRIFNVGRLDKDSQGLILLTNDGDIVNKILRAANNHEKEYVVEVNRSINDEFVRSMSGGVRILGAKTKPCRVFKEGERRFRIVLTQGLNRQIRRMCDVLGYDVVKLKRVRVMNIKLESLAIGQWRYLSPQELEVLNQSLEDSDSTERASVVEGAPKARKFYKRADARGDAPFNREAPLFKRDGKNSAPKSGVKSSSKPGVKSSAKPFAKAGAKSSSKPGVKSSAKPFAKAGAKSASSPKSSPKFTSKPASKVVNRFSEKAEKTERVEKPDRFSESAKSSNAHKTYQQYKNKR